MNLPCSNLHHKSSIITTSSQKWLIRCKYSTLPLILTENHLPYEAEKNLWHGAMYVRDSQLCQATQRYTDMRRKKKTLCGLQKDQVQQRLQDSGAWQRPTALFSMVPQRSRSGLHQLFCVCMRLWKRNQFRAPAMELWTLSPWNLPQHQ